MRLARRILLAFPDGQCTLDEITDQQWQSFLEALGIIIEPPTINHWQTLSILLRLGLRVQRLEHWLDGEDRFLLVPTFASVPLLCSDLAREGRLSTTQCCEDCHRESGMLIEHFMEDRRIAYVCCQSLWVLDNCGQCQMLAEHE